MSPFSASRSLRILLAALALASGLSAQSYQTSFAGEAFDRTVGPGTVHNGVKINASDGSIDLSIPLGPGIGTRGIKFQPMINGHIGPTMNGNIANPATCPTKTVVTNTQNLLNISSPGFLDLDVSTFGAPKPQISPVSNYWLFNGMSGSFNNFGTNASPTPVAVPSGAALNPILNAFGYSGGTTCGAPVPAGTGAFEWMDSNGGLVLGLQSSTMPYQSLADVTYSSNPNFMAVGGTIQFPAQILVVSGDVAYEFSYLPAVGPAYYATSFLNTPPTTTTVVTLKTVRYFLTAMHNRYGEAILFTYGGGCTYSAAWVQSGAANGIGITLDTAGNLEYSGMASPPSYQLAIPTISQGALGLVNTYLTQMTVVATGEVVKFNYSTLPDIGTSPTSNTPGWPSTFGLLPNEIPQALSSINFPNRTLAFTWTPYLYLKNGGTPWEWDGYNGNPIIDSFSPDAGTYESPNWFWGVTEVDDSDLASGITYTTLHNRVIPQAVYSTLGGPPITWASTAFYDVVTNPDLTVTVNRFAEPVNGYQGQPASSSSAGDTIAHQMQMLAHLKHLPTEIRHYLPSVYSASDLANTPANSSAYAIEVFDRWDLKSEANPNGAFTYTAVPAPTRTQSWDNNTHLFRVSEHCNWDSQNLGWQSDYSDASFQASPSLVRPDNTANVLSLALQGLGATYPLGSGSAARLVSRTFSSDYSNWFLGRPVTDVTSNLADGTGDFTPTSTYPSLPATLPTTVRNYDSPAVGLNRILSVTRSVPSGTSVATTYNWTGTAGTLVAGELPGVSVAGSSDLAGPTVGVAMYGYDGYGFLNRIQPLGIGWNVQQSQDGLGRPVTQTDANNLTTHISWDGGGRLDTITPPGSEIGTSINYDSDILGEKVIRGSQVTEYRYDGHGQLVLIRRWNDADIASHKAFQYDKAGHKLFESIWRSGSGTDTEGLTGGTDGDTFTYDGRGRVLTHTDANLVLTTTAYAVGSWGWTVTVAGATTTCSKDALGRLSQVVDALGQPTRYFYDAADHLALSQQTGNSVTQSRTWNYHPMGWLSSITQPESGTTTYSSFTVSGKPLTTTYAGDGSGAARGLNSTVDSLMRVTSVTSTDGTVSQVFGYDNTAPQGAAWAPGTFGLANNHRNYTSDGGVQQGFFYGTQPGSDPNGGWLDTLQTVIPTPASAQPQTFVQQYSYDDYGNRQGIAVDGRAVSMPYYPAQGLPQSITYASTVVDSAVYDPTSWVLSTLTGTGSSTSFGYDPDQVRVHNITNSNQTTGNQTLIYHYDAADQIYQIDETLGSGSTVSDVLGHDLLNRVTSATIWNTDHTVQCQQNLSYDGFGNTYSSSTQALTGALPNSSQSPWFTINNFTLTGPEMATMASTNRMPATAGGISTGILYDPQGNMTQLWGLTGMASTLETMTLDTLGRVTSTWNALSGVTESYGYTADGLRVAVNRSSSGTFQQTNFHIYNDARQLVSEYQMAGSGTLVSAVKTAAVVKTVAPVPEVSITYPPAYVALSYTGPTGIEVGTPISVSGSYTCSCAHSAPSFSWNFGDGTTSKLQSLTHTYLTQGVYTISLTAGANSVGTIKAGGCIPGAASAAQTLTVVAPPVITGFSASASVLSAGQPLILSWSASNATSYSINNGIGAVSGSSCTIYPTAVGSSPVTNSYVLTATNTLNGVSFSTTSAIVTVIVYPDPSTPTMSLTASASPILVGQPSTLTWNVSNAVGSLTVTLNGVVVPASGSQVVTPSSTTVYTLAATSTELALSRYVSTPVTVTVFPDPTVPGIGFSASANAIVAGQSTTLTWSVANAAGALAVTLNGVSVPTSGCQVVSPASTTSYVMVATSTELTQTVTSSATAAITVDAPPTSPTLTLSANPSVIQPGQSSTLSWSVSDAVGGLAVTLNGASVPATGTQTVSPSATTSYALVASSTVLNESVSQTRTATVTVVPPPMISSFTVSSGSESAGGVITLSWSVANATSLTLNSDALSASQLAQGSISQAPIGTTSYTLVASNSMGTVSQTVTVNVTGSGSLTWVRDILYLGSREVAEWDNAGMHVIQSDILGSPRYVVNGSGVVEGQQKFLPFGETLDRRGSFTAAKGFTNHEQTDPSGMIYMQARFYLPQYHRFSSPDPARDQHFEETQSWNIYSYCENNPVMRTDPTGEFNFLNTFNRMASAVGNYVKGVGQALFGEAKGVAAVGEGIAKAAANPEKTLEGLANAVAHPVNTAKAVGSAVSTAVATANTPEQAGKLVGEALTAAFLVAAPFAEAGASGEVAAAAEGGVTDVPGNKVPFEGDPGSTLRGGTGSRTYGPDGFPQTDRDLPHPDEVGFGSGDHAHDWGRPADGGRPTHLDRGLPREPIPGDPPPPRGPNVPPGA